MLKIGVLPKEAVKGNYDVRKLTMCEIDSEISVLVVGKKMDILEHGHEKDQWEVYLDVFNATAYVCEIGKSHHFFNCDKEKRLLAIKGRNATGDELKQLFTALGMNVIMQKWISNNLESKDTVFERCCVLKQFINKVLYLHFFFYIIEKII